MVKQEPLDAHEDRKREDAGGVIYNCRDLELEIEHQKIKKLIRLYNLVESLPERQTILQKLSDRSSNHNWSERLKYPHGKSMGLAHHGVQRRRGA